MGLKDSVVTFLVGLVIGSAGIHTGALLVLGSSHIETAAVTALVGAVVWFLASHFFGWVPFFGIVLTFFTWLAVINSRYSGGWTTALKIAAVAWVASVVGDYIMRELGFRRSHAVGVPEA
ncbi:MAG: hypothetical protein ABEK04_03825 [Candidatus Nanohalobium sp.]